MLWVIKSNQACSNCIDCLFHPICDEASISGPPSGPLSLVYLWTSIHQLLKTEALGSQRSMGCGGYVTITIRYGGGDGVSQHHSTQNIDSRGILWSICVKTALVVRREENKLTPGGIAGCDWRSSMQ